MKSWAIIGLSVIVAATSIYHLGKLSGKQVVYGEWNQAVIDQNLKIQEIRNEYAKQEKEYQKTISDLSLELQKSETEFNTQLDSIKSDYAKRLLTSEERASVYKRMSEAGTIERRNLADYATKLDKSLEEGRGLVRELWATLRQRERELTILGSQLNADRHLLDKAELLHDRN